MSYEYANARIRALRGLILRGRDLELLAALPGVGELVAALARTDLAADLEATGQWVPTVETVDAATRHSVGRRLGAMTGFFEEGSDARHLVRIVLMRYDLDNTVALIRAKAAGIAPAEISGSVVPVGALDDERLAALAASADLAAMAELIRSWALPFARELVAELPRVREHGRLALIEATLRRGFEEWVCASLRGGDANAALVREWAAIEAGGVRAGIASRLAAHGMPPAADAVARPVPARPLRALARAIAAAPLSSDLRDPVRAERAIDGYRARWARAQLLRDPLGIAVAICYVAEKEQEARALRLIARKRILS